MSGTTNVTMKMLTFRSNLSKQRKSGLCLVFYLLCTFSLYSVSCTKSVSERTRNSWEGRVFASALSWTHIVALASLLLHTRNLPLSCTGMTAKTMERWYKHIIGLYWSSYTSTLKFSFISLQTAQSSRSCSIWRIKKDKKRWKLSKVMNPKKARRKVRDFLR